MNVSEMVRRYLCRDEAEDIYCMCVERGDRWWGCVRIPGIKRADCGEESDDDEDSDAEEASDEEDSDEEGADERAEECIRELTRVVRSERSEEKT